MTLPKPERVEVGQWWVPKCGDESPWRIEPRHMQRASGSADPMDSDWSWLTDDYDYAGSREHPEPSEWMIETLANHINAIADRANEPTDHARMLASHIIGGGHTRWNDLREGVFLERAVVSMYLTLRSLGKW